MAGIEDNTDSASSTTSEMINTADIDKRLRTLTESGKELFENKQRKFLLKMQIVKSDLQLLARNIEPYSNELTSLQELKTEFMSGTVRYDTICKEYLDFLSRTNTAEGMDEVHKLSGEMQDFTQFVETESKRMNTFINELRAIERENSLASRSSRRSHSSRKTHSSSSSSVLARARAKAEAAKVKVHFAEKETLLLKEKALIEEKRSIESAKVERKKADIEADLDLLSRQKEAAAVEAEANALQNECDENMSQVLPDQPPLDSKSKTAAYINHVQKQISSIEIDKENTDAFHIDKENKHSTHIDQENTHVSGTLDPHANSFIPRKNIIADTHVSDNHPYPSDRTLATDFTRFLLKRDLLMSSQQANTGFKDKLPTTKGKLNDVRTRKTDFAETKNERSQSVDPHRISIFPPCTSELKIDEVRTLEVDESAYDKIGKDVICVWTNSLTIIRNSYGIAIQVLGCGPCGYDDATKEARRWCTNCYEGLCEECTNCYEGLCEDCENAHIKTKYRETIRLYRLKITARLKMFRSLRILRRLKSTEEKITKLREQTLHIKQFSSDIQVFLGTYQGNKSRASETKSIKDAMDTCNDL
ncbi:unnamed protein product [Mytilus edulis]|uniref:Uncharacterized protein n=1 Tax=Mytilus edulis TaxID=6550 RepID=A0A8S3SMQ6_MYTED|nr:unnamed protein product [Mytilus edulis]